MHVSKVEQKHVFLKIYSQISNLEKAINKIKKSGFTKIMISVLGKLIQGFSADSMALGNNSKDAQSFFKELLGTDVDLDSFYNQETGHVLVTGFLVPMFVEPVGKKKLGELSGGPYGILKGLGFSKIKVMTYIKELSEGLYLLVVRGNRFEIESLEECLDTF